LAKNPGVPVTPGAALSTTRATRGAWVPASSSVVHRPERALAPAASAASAVAFVEAGLEVICTATDPGRLLPETGAS
jgi:hypothetical protein